MGGWVGEWVGAQAAGGEWLGAWPPPSTTHPHAPPCAQTCWPRCPPLSTTTWWPAATSTSHCSLTVRGRAAGELVRPGVRPGEGGAAAHPHRHTHALHALPSTHPTHPPTHPHHPHSHTTHAQASSLIFASTCWCGAWTPPPAPFSTGRAWSAAAPAPTRAPPPPTWQTPSATSPTMRVGRFHRWTLHCDCLLASYRSSLLLDGRESGAATARLPTPPLAAPLPPPPPSEQAQRGIRVQHVRLFGRG